MKAKIIIAALAFSALAAAMLTLAQSAPQLINYQGRLTNPAGQPLDGVTVDMTFAFYGAEAGSTACLSILQPDVLVTAGIYNVLLGSGAINPGTESTLASVFQNHTDVWMGIKVDAEAEMTPRQRITSVPYALRSSQADHASSIDYAALSAAVFNDPDHDGDGHNSILAGGDDCNDDNPDSFPGATEIHCDGIDQNCDGLDIIFNNTRITNDASDGWAPSLSWSGTEFGLSWMEYRDGNNEIYFARLSPDGPKIGADSRITNDGGESQFPSLAGTGSEFGVSWVDDRDGNSEIYFARITSAGSKIGMDTRITIDGGNSWGSALVWTGSEFGISWGDDRDGNQEIYFARISAVGSKVEADGRITNDNGWSQSPSLSWTGSEFGVSWSDDRDGNSEIYFARISAAGSKVGADERITSMGGHGEYPSLVWNGSGFGIGWEETRDGDPEIYFTRVSAAGAKIRDDARITTAPGNSSRPSLSWSGSEYGMSWGDARDGDYEPYFVRLSAAGAKIGRDAKIAGDHVASQGYFPLDWSGSEFGISWDDWVEGNIEIYFTRAADCP